MGLKIAKDAGRLLEDLSDITVDPDRFNTMYEYMEHILNDRNAKRYDIKYNERLLYSARNLDTGRKTSVGKSEASVICSEHGSILYIDKNYNIGGSTQIYVKYDGKPYYFQHCKVNDWGRTVPSMFILIEDNMRRLIDDLCFDLKYATSSNIKNISKFDEWLGSGNKLEEAAKYYKKK